MIGLLLLIVSSVLRLAFWLPLYLYGIFSSLSKKEFGKWSLDLAIAKDQYGNALGKYLFNDVLLAKESKHYFGNIDETISSVIGKNKREGTLSIGGRILDTVLNLIEKNHTTNSIDETERQTTNNKP